ncbi:sodium/hydrogen exchanger 8-like isoform X2 [Ruditapes philippinarum]|uniref:sodium/hydrogen exchanger 8-like isoform X2 n=1 Tax=Ruditapes philippinarum TaxID=129788 RepID=UPI00295B1B9F|nr:sodium/hydrogen exchanger 8-like isoform X2 [Ruditapes philippinarum]
MLLFNFSTLIFVLLLMLGTVLSAKAATGPQEVDSKNQQPKVQPDPDDDESSFLKNILEDARNLTDGDNTTTTTTTTTPKPTLKPTNSPPDLPDVGESEKEHKSSLTIFFILLVIAICILMTHMLLQTKFHYLPESIAVVLVGALIGLVLKIFKFGNWSKEEAFPPTIFFIVLLPPIIFESGYNLHKGNFFQNIGTILVFAIIGTAISAMVVGGGIYLLGQAQVAYEFTVVESFAFGSLISAVDPVATLAIFHSLNVDEVLYMLVFGESILNDAVAITLTVTVLEFENPEMANVTGSAAFFKAVLRFLVMFFGSSLIGMVSGLVSALLLKFVDLRKTPSLEIGMMLVFSYLPYGLAEGLHLSGIMAILMSGIVMSHYTHHNLSPVTQITVQHTFRTIAFMAETCVFAYIGMAFFSFKFVFKPALVIWSITLILIGRAVNIFPLSFISNYFREHKITKKQQFIMWFSGLRGAIAFALSLHLEFDTPEKRYVLVTTTLIIVLFTILFLGGSTMPMMKLLKAEKKEKKRRKSEREISLSKTKEMGDTVDSEHLSEYTESEAEVSFAKPSHKGFVRVDARYLIPFFTRKFTQQEVRDAKTQMTNLTKQWFNDVRAAPSESSEEEEETLFINSRHNSESNEPLLQ